MRTYVVTYRVAILEFRVFVILVCWNIDPCTLALIMKWFPFTYTIWTFLYGIPISYFIPIL